LCRLNGARWWFHPGGQQPFLTQLRPFDPLAALSYLGIGLETFRLLYLLLRQKKRIFLPIQNDQEKKKKQGETAHEEKKSEFEIA
jgi:hypothetical protein